MEDWGQLFWKDFVMVKIDADVNWSWLKLAVLIELSSSLGYHTSLYIYSIFLPTSNKVFWQQFSNMILQLCSWKFRLSAQNYEP